MASDTAGKRHTADLRVIGILALMALPFLCALSAAVGLLDPNVRHAMTFVAALIPYVMSAVSVAFSLAIVVAVFYAAGLAATDIMRRWHNRTHVYPNMAGMFPLVRGDYNWHDFTPDAVKAVHAWTHAQAVNGVKPQSKPTQAAISAALYGHPASVAPVIRTIEPKPVALPNPASFPRKAYVYDASSLAQPALLVGVDGSGKRLHYDLHNLGNVLIGGLPGTGKSELMAAMMVGIINRNDAAGDVRMAVIDTKRVDFGLLPNDLNAMWMPVAREMDEGRNLMSAALVETRDRFGRMEAVGARTLRMYNSRVQPGDQLPYLTLFVDELWDWYADAIFEEAVKEVGRKGRAAGVNFVLATQRGAADAMSSALRATAGLRIAFPVANSHDSRAILDETGAELLPRNIPGRCLVKYDRTIEVQSYLAGIEEERFDRFTTAAPRGSLSQPKLVAQPQPPTTGLNHPSQPVVTLEPGRAPTPEQAQYMRQLKARGWSQNRIIYAMWSYKDGIVNDFARDALEGRI